MEVYMSSKNWPILSLLEQDEPVFNWPMVQQLSNWPSMSNMASTNLSVWEDENRVMIEADMPGVKKEDVDVTFEKGILTIRGSSKESEEDKKRKYFRKRNSSFIYRMNVPGNIDEHQEPKASLSNGIMQIEFKKQKKDQPKKIQVT